MPDTFTKHTRPELSIVLPDIKMVRDAARGANYVKSRGELYLPRVGNQDNESYDRYLKRAFFLGAVSATIKGYVSSVFRKPIEVKGVHADELKNIDKEGGDIQSYANNVFKELLISGRVVQWIAPVGNTYYVMPYKSEQAINWKNDDFVTLVEHRRGGSPSTQPLEYNVVDALRVVRRTSKGSIAISSKALSHPISFDDDQLPLTEGETKNITIPDIGIFPVVPITPDGITFLPETIPLLDLAEANFDHYRLSADLRQGLHTAPFPVFWAAGFGKDSELRIGADTAWVSPHASGNAGVLEYRGWALEHLIATLNKIEGAMISFGARMLEQDKRASETAEALRTRQASQEANIIGLVRSVSAGITIACKCLIAYRLGVQAKDVDLEIALPTDLVETRLTSDEIVAIVTGWMNGAVPDTMLEHNYRQGELIPTKTSTEEFLTELNEARARKVAMDAAKVLQSNTPNAKPNITPKPNMEG